MPQQTVLGQKTQSRDTTPPRVRLRIKARRLGVTLRTNDDVRRYLLKGAGFAVVPFQAFGVPEDTGWFRLSVGAVSLAEIERVLPLLKQAVEAAS